MKQKERMGLSFLFLVVMVLSGCSASYPDDIVPLIDNLDLRMALVRDFDANSDGKLTPDEVKHIKEIDLGYKIEGELSDMEYLSALESFEGNCIKTVNLDFSKNSNMENIHIMNVENLKKIKVNPNIQSVSINRAKSLKEVIMEPMPFLQFLCVSESPLAELKTRKCPSLTTLTVDKTNLDKIDLSLYPRLETLYCSSTNIGELDLSMLSNLHTVRCKGVARIILSSEQKIAGLNIVPDYKYCIDKNTEIIVK